MAQNWPVFLLFGVALFASSDGVMNLLGAGINFPLINWSSEQLLDVFQSNSTVNQICRANKVTPNVLSQKKARVQGCRSKLTGGSGRATPDVMCRHGEAFVKCIRESAHEIGTTCKMTSDQQDMLEYEIANYEAMSKKMCSKKDEIGKVTEKKRCAETKAVDLRKCMTDHKKPNMKYDKEGCHAAFDFVDCVSKRMKECDKETGKLVKSFMMEGLMATPCENYDHSKNSGGISSAQLLSVFLSCVFAIKFI